MEEGAEEKQETGEKLYSGILPASTGSLQFLLSHEVILYKKKMMMKEREV